MIVRVEAIGVQLECTDAFQWLSTLPDESADLIVTDPPYESLEKHRAVGTTTRLKQSKASSNAWFAVLPNEVLPRLLSELYRILRVDRHCYVFCDDTTSDVLKVAANAVGFKVWKRLVWDKCTLGMGYHYRCRYEFILFLEKGRRRLRDLAIADVLACRRVYNGYPAEKPYELMHVLVSQSAEAGELVVDPFFGSGVTAVAALAQGCSFAGCDANPLALTVATARVDAQLLFSEISS